MDNKLLFLMLTACFCGSIKNSINLPDEFQGRLAKAVEHKRQYPKALPYHMERYREIRNSENDDFKGNDMNYITIYQQKLYLHSTPIALLEYQIF